MRFRRNSPSPISDLVEQSLLPTGIPAGRRSGRWYLIGRKAPVWLETSAYTDQLDAAAAARAAMERALAARGPRAM